MGEQRERNQRPPPQQQHQSEDAAEHRSRVPPPRSRPPQRKTRTNSATETGHRLHLPRHLQKKRRWRLSARRGTSTNPPKGLTPSRSASPKSPMDGSSSCSTTRTGRTKGTSSWQQSCAQPSRWHSLLTTPAD